MVDNTLVCKGAMPEARLRCTDSSCINHGGRSVNFNELRQSTTVCRVGCQTAVEKDSDLKWQSTDALACQRQSQYPPSCSTVHLCSPPVEITQQCCHTMLPRMGNTSPNEGALLSFLMQHRQHNVLAQDWMAGEQNENRQG